MKKVMMAGLLSVSLALAGCSSTDEPDLSGPTQKSLDALAADAVKTDVKLPDFTKDGDPKARETYALAYQYDEVLRYMPCYCGCGKDGHKSNLNCYIKDKRENGDVVWDTMGMT